MPIAPETSPEQVAEIVGLLADSRQSVETIDQSVARDDFDPTKLVMTSMGNPSRAVITPYYPALQYEPKLVDRFVWSKIYDRPFVEASLTFSRRRLLANVTLRLCVDPQLDVVEETGWCYPLAAKHVSTQKTEDVVSAIREQGMWGYSHNHRSGLIVMTPEREDRKNKRNWVLSHIMEPEAIVEGMVARIPRLPFTEL